MNHTSKYIALFFGALLCGALVYATVFSFLGYRFIKLRLIEASSQFYTSGLMRYGVVLARDDESRTLEISMQRFPGDTKRLIIFVPEYAAIMRQDLIRTGDAYASLSPRRAAALSDIATGTRIALQVVQDGDRFAALTVIFGDPL